MGNASSTEQQQQHHVGSGSHHHHTLNPLARPRSHAGASSSPSAKSSQPSSSSHNPLVQTSSAHGRSSPSWTRHGSLRRGSSQAPSSSSAQQIKNAFFRDTSTPSTATGSGTSRRSSGRRSRSGSVNLTLQQQQQQQHAQTTPNTPSGSRFLSSTNETGEDPTTPTGGPREPRERSATMGSTSLDSKYASAAATQKKTQDGSSTRSPPPPSLGGSLFRRASRADKTNIDLQDVQDDSTSSNTSPTPSSAGLPAWNASLGAHSIISPHPSPSIATDARHVSGTTTYSSTDAAGKAASPQTVPPPHASSNRAFGRGVAAIFSNPSHSLGSTVAASMATSTIAGSFSPTGHDSSDGDRDEGGSGGASAEPSSPFDHESGGSNSASARAKGLSSATSGHGAALDGLGRQVAAAFPSYLKIPTLIPSKQEQPLQPPSSIPGSPTGSAPGSGNVTPGSSGWSGVAATAARATSAVLTPEEVVILPGEASRVSSPTQEEHATLSAVSGEPQKDGEAEHVASSHPESPRDVPNTDVEEKRKSTDTVGPRTQTSLSRTPTPTQKSHHATRALTPARLDATSHNRAPSTETETSSEQMRRLHVATGVASGATTPVMPIPPGLTSAPPSAMSPAVSSGYATPARQGSDLKVDVSTPAAAIDDRGAKTPTDSPSGVATPSATTPKSRHPPHLTPYYYRNTKGPISLMPIVITWRGGGKEVFVTGTFANEWRSKILLKRTSSGSSSSAARRANAAKEEHTVVLHLPPGTHRMKFIVDDRWRVSRELPTASDGDGNLVNYLEIPNVGPAHPGPLSAPGEDLIDGDERRRERGIEKIKEAERAARKQRPGSRGSQSDKAPPQAAMGADKQDQERGATSSASEGWTSSAGEADASLVEAARRKAVLDLREEARRAELEKTGQLEEVFGVDDEALRAAESWVQEIPESVVKAHYAEEQYQDELERNDGHHHQSSQSGSPPPPPPSLPRQLEKVILNSSPANPALAPPGGTVDDNSILPAPNHVVLNHLTASAIKGGVLAVGTTTRYKRKYVTTVFYKPVQT